MLTITADITPDDHLSQSQLESWFNNISGQSFRAYTINKVQVETEKKENGNGKLKRKSWD